MDQLCEDLMLESIEEMDEIDEAIWSESMMYLVDTQIEDYVVEATTNIFNSDSESTIDKALNDLLAVPMSDESDTTSSPDYGNNVSRTVNNVNDIDKELFDNELYTKHSEFNSTISEEDLKNEFCNDDEYNHNKNYNYLFSDSE